MSRTMIVDIAMEREVNCGEAGAVTGRGVAVGYSAPVYPYGYQNAYPYDCTPSYVAPTPSFYFGYSDFNYNRGPKFRGPVNHHHNHGGHNHFNGRRGRRW